MYVTCMSIYVCVCMDVMIDTGMCMAQRIFEGQRITFCVGFHLTPRAKQGLLLAVVELSRAGLWGFGDLPAFILHFRLEAQRLQCAPQHLAFHGFRVSELRCSC